MWKSGHLVCWSVHVQPWLLIPPPGLPEQPDLWNFLNFVFWSWQEVTPAVPRRASHSHFPQITRLWAECGEGRLSVVFAGPMESLCKQGSTTELPQLRVSSTWILNYHLKNRLFKIIGFLQGRVVLWKSRSNWFTDRFGLWLPLHVFLPFQQNNKIRDFLENGSQN